jgi:molecular chaperone GrpE
MNNDINDTNDEVKIDLDNDLDSESNEKLETIIDLDAEKVAHNTDDITVEDDEIVSEEESENPKAYIKKLKDEIKQIKKDKSDLLTNWQKDKADFINARKRDEETKADVIKFSNQLLINDLLPIIDGYEQAKAQPTWTIVDEAWRKGIEAIIDKVYNALQKAGVESYGKVGDVFDPNIYEALGQEKTDDKAKDHTVSLVMQKGYKLHDKVIRVSMVKVYGLE